MTVHCAIYITQANEGPGHDPVLFAEGHSSDNGANTDAPANIVTAFIATHFDDIARQALHEHEQSKGGPTGDGGSDPAPAVIAPPQLSLVNAQGTGLITH
jgi:hypothetical protein